MDVIEEILTRLPVKHVLRCKLLSKSCYDLIETPSFVKKHLDRRRHQSDSSSRIIVGRKKKSDHNSWIIATLSSSSSTPSLEGESQYCIPSNYLLMTLVGSCNGLLVFSSAGLSGSLTVCNPATGKYMPVPKPPPLEQHILMSNTTALGFAYDSKSGDYKVIKIGKYYSSSSDSSSSSINDDGTTYSILIQVWNMTTNSWKQINPPSPLLPCLLSKNRYPFRCDYGLLVNGILYWLARGERYSGHDPTILSFDPTNNTFGEIGLPTDVDRPNLIDFMGSLALSTLCPHNDRFFDIWVMGGCSVWTKTFSIGPFRSGENTSQVCINGYFVLYEVVRWPFQSMEECNIILFDPHRKTVVSEAKVKGLRPYSTTVWSVTESLVSV